MLQHVKHSLRSLALAIPGGTAAYRWCASALGRRRFRRMFPGLATTTDAAAIFDHVYRTNAWGRGESVSGPGSTLTYTAHLRGELPRLARDLGVKTLLDAPCGDAHWIRAVEWHEPIRYVGGDICAALIDRNRATNDRAGWSFLPLDIRHDALPPSDLWLCRDCLFHLPERDVLAVLHNFLRHDIPYLLTSCHTECRINADVPTGGFRLINLQLPPYGLPEPLTTIDDWLPGHVQRHLALWSREQVAAALADRGKPQP
jgi:hypothetical protein